MNAILWDGYKQLKGELEMDDYRLRFSMEDFRDSSLNLEIALADVGKITFQKIYGITHHACRIDTKDGRSNVFVVDDVEALRQCFAKINPI